jgi:predicted peroxiredoxin
VALPVVIIVTICATFLLNKDNNVALPVVIIVTICATFLLNKDNNVDDYLRKVTEHCKVWVCSHSLAEVAGSNSSGDMGVSLF